MAWNKPRGLLWVATVLLILLAWPPHWYPYALRVQLSQWFGATDYQPLPDTAKAESPLPEPFCPDENQAWREAQSSNPRPFNIRSTNQGVWRNSADFCSR